jgi:hypothetical protein
LLPNGQISRTKFMGQRILMDLLQKASTQRIRNDKRPADNSPGQRIQSVSICVHLCSSVVSISFRALSPDHAPLAKPYATAQARDPSVASKITANGSLLFLGAG